MSRAASRERSRRAGYLIINVYNYQMHYVYMIKNPNNDLYIGISEDTKKRLDTHNGRSGALFTKRDNKFHIVFLEEYKTLAEARTREIQLKKWRREKKEVLIERYSRGLDTK